jgi:hypothetical protein
MAQVTALVRELVLEKLLAGEVLEIRIVDPALAHGFVGQTVDVFEQEEPDDEPGLDPGPALVVIERRDLAIDPVPVDLAGELHQLVLRVDDLLRAWRETDHLPPSSSASLVASSPPMRPPNHVRRFEGIMKMKSQASEAPDPESLQSKTTSARKN